MQFRNWWLVARKIYWSGKDLRLPASLLFWTNSVIQMDQYKTVLSSLLMLWRYCSFTPSFQNDHGWPSTQPNQTAQNPTIQHRAAAWWCTAWLCTSSVWGMPYLTSLTCTHHPTNCGWYLPSCFRMLWIFIPTTNFTNMHITLQYTTKPQRCVQHDSVLQGFV